MSSSNESQLMALAAVRSGIANSVWLPSQFYEAMPVLFPFAIRSNDAVGGNRGVPDDFFFAKDENCLIKNLFQSVTIACSTVGGRRTGHVACHIVRPRDHLSTRNGTRHDHQLSAELNSFVGNLLWLPKSLAPHTDYHTKASGGSATIVTKYLVELSANIYGARTRRAVGPHSGMQQRLWDKLFETANKVVVPGPLRNSWQKWLISDTQRAGLLSAGAPSWGVVGKIQSLWFESHAYHRVLEEQVRGTRGGVVSQSLNQLFQQLLPRWNKRQAIQRFAQGVGKMCRHPKKRTAAIVQAGYLEHYLDIVNVVFIKKKWL